METNIKNIQDLIKRSQEVNSLTEKSRKSDGLQRALQHHLPSMLADYCQVQSYEQGVLTLSAATGSAATQLRFVVQQLLPKLKKHHAFRELERIQIRIQAPVDTRVGRPHQIRNYPPVSELNRQLILETADGLNDQKLADALRQLASTLGKDGKD